MRELTIFRIPNYRWRKNETVDNLDNDFPAEDYSILAKYDDTAISVLK